MKFKYEENTIDNYIKKIKSFGNVYHTGKNGYKFLKNPININEDNNVLFLTNNKTFVLQNLLKFNNSINKLEIQSPKILPNMKFQNIKDIS